MGFLNLSKKDKEFSLNLLLNYAFFIGELVKKLRS